VYTDCARCFLIQSFDITIHNYGPEKLIGSAHIAIPDSLTAAWVDNLQRAITKKVYEDTGVEMLGITIYAVNSADTEAIAVRESVRKLAEQNPSVRAVHGFYLDKVDKVISFEAETDFNSGDEDLICQDLLQRIEINTSLPDHYKNPVHRIFTDRHRVLFLLQKMCAKFFRRLFT